MNARRASGSSFLRTIVGTAQWQPPAGRELLYSEYEIGCYERMLPVPDAIDHEKIQASVEEGVVNVVLPKADTAKPKQIPIRTAE